MSVSVDDQRCTDFHYARVPMSLVMPWLEVGVLSV